MSAAQAAALAERVCATADTEPTTLMVGATGVNVSFDHEPRELVEAFDLAWVEQLDQWYAVVDGIVLSVAAG